MSNSLISKGLNIMSAIGTASATNICPLYRISFISRVTISRVDCIYLHRLKRFIRNFFPLMNNNAYI